MRAFAVGGLNASSEAGAECPVGVDVEIVSFEARVYNNAVLVGIVGAHGVVAMFVAATGAEFVALAEGRAQHCVLPVGAFAQGGNFFVGISAFVVEIGLLERGPLRGVHQVELVQYSVYAGREAVIDVRASGATFFRSDKNYAIGAARAVNSCGRNVFEHFDRLNVARVDCSQWVQRTFYGADARLCSTCVFVVNEAVNHVKGLIACVDRVATTYAKLSCSAWLTRRSRDIEACHDATKCLIYCC